MWIQAPPEVFWAGRLRTPPSDIDAYSADKAILVRVGVSCLQRLG